MDRASAGTALNAITKKDACHAAEQVADVKKRHPEVTDIFGGSKFRGQEQKKTPAADLRGAARLACFSEGFKII